MKAVCLYTTHPGGEWLPWSSYFTPVDIRMILDVLVPQDSPESHDCLDKSLPPRLISHLHYQHFGDTPNWLYVPGADTLPIFHSILLPTGARWDASKRQWTFYICGDDFKEWWADYVAHFRPDDEPEEREYWWLDRGSAMSTWGVRGRRGDPTYQGVPADNT